MLSRYKELRHVELNLSAAAGVRVDQREAGQPLLHANQQRMEPFDAPIAVEVGKRRIAILADEFPADGTRRLHLQKLVDIELYETFDQSTLETAGNLYAYAFGVGLNCPPPLKYGSRITSPRAETRNLRNTGR